MSRTSRLELDEIGSWSVIKLDIIRKYAKAYSTILTANHLHHVYIDAFAGAGTHVVKGRCEEVLGSPQIAVNTEPPFREYHFIDLNGQKAANLRRMFQGRQNVTVYEGDCNYLMLDRVLPRVRYEDYRRGLCLLDPYGLHLNWEVICRAGQMKTLDVFLNFPIMDMNRNVFWENPDGVDDADVERMNAFWGDNSWRRAAYKSTPTLFGDRDEKTDNRTVVIAFRDRLRRVAGFSNVPEPIPMRNSRGAVVYYLFFASAKPVAQDIVTDIFTTYRNQGAC